MTKIIVEAYGSDSYEVLREGLENYSKICWSREDLVTELKNAKKGIKGSIELVTRGIGKKKKDELLKIINDHNESKKFK